MNKIQVGILKNKEIYFHLHHFFAPQSSVQITETTCKASIENKKIVLQIADEKYFFEKEITLYPCNEQKSYFEIKDVVIGVDFHWQQTENQKFKGLLCLLKIGDELQVINELLIEDYLSSVISSEMSADCSLEFLKAHSVISRSWLLAQIEKKNECTQKNKGYSSVLQSEEEYIRWYDRENHQNFDVCADDHCQRYQGITRIKNENAQKAIQQTIGVVLMNNEKICDARFSKCCGGVSELFQNCWENTPHSYLTKVVDSGNKQLKNNLELSNEQEVKSFIEDTPEAFCNTTDTKIISQVLNDYDTKTSQFFRWQITYNQQEISHLLKEKSGIDFGNIIDLVPIERGVSGRLIKLKIVGTRKTMVVGKELEIRRWLSKTHLYSSAFIIKKKDIQNAIPQQFVLNGAGWGHGVGLCQIGAANMGEKGFRYEEILAHYFKNTYLKKIY